MPSQRIAVVLVLMAGVVLVDFGCRDREPEPQYNYNLGTDGTNLLPPTGQMLDTQKKIASGKADVYKRSDMEVTGGATSGSGSGSVSNSNASNATIGVIAESNLPDDIDEAVQQLVDKYNQALVSKDYDGLVSCIASRQRSTARDMFDLKDELETSLASALDSVNTLIPGIKEMTLQRVSMAKKIALEGMSVTSDTVVSGTLLVAGGVRKEPMTLELEDGEWLLVHPLIPGEDAWGDREAAYEDATDELDDIVSSMASGGQVDPAAVQKATANALLLLLDLPQHGK